MVNVGQTIQYRDDLFYNTIYEGTVDKILKYVLDGLHSRVYLIKIEEEDGDILYTLIKEGIILSKEEADINKRKQVIQTKINELQHELRRLND